MRKTVATVLVVAFIAGSSPIVAAGAENGPLARAGVAEATRLATVNAAQTAQRPAAQNRSWGWRHPVLAGALVGTGGGALVGAVSGSCDQNQFCPVGTGGAMALVAVLGAGIGSIAGFIVGASRK